jgi:tripartite-type tricarboxylate transporter receptor subunit TctC
MNKKRSLMRRAFLAAVLSSSALLVPVAHAEGPDGYPHGPVTIIVPFVPGGATDVIARNVAEALRTRWGKNVLVENKPGASGVIGTEYVARARPDGHTLLLGTQTALAVTPVLSKTLRYNVEKDFTPISLLVTTPLVLLASEKAGASTASDLIRMLKDKPGKYSYGTSGIGTSQHLTALLFLNQINADALHVPYKGAGQFLVDIAGGQLDMGFDNMGTALAIAKQGKARALALTGLTRSPREPNLPTLAESGVPGFEAVTWLGLLAPGGMSGPLTRYLNDEVTAVLNDPAFQQKLAAQGFTPRPMSSDEFKKYIKSETERFAYVIRKNGVVVE